MFLKLLLLQIIAHLLSDFIFQGQSMSDKKGLKVINIHHLYHTAIVGVLSYVCSLDFSFWKAALILAIFHLATDVFKSWLSTVYERRNFFFLDQLIHLIFIVLVTWSYSNYFGISFLFPISFKTIAVIAGFVLCSKPANILIKNLLETFSIKIPGDENDEKRIESLPNAGRLIGITERYITLALVIIGQYGVVGLLIAAKSILRFSSKRNEYVLVGTLLSYSVSIISGILINLIK